MRFVAHPTPDAYLYSVMIRACAEAPESQAERALDLWTELRIDNKLVPTRESYNAIILACARASKDSESFAADAFGFASEMLDAFRAGATQLRPNVETFSALLESVKRTGDLKRVRWILAELVKVYTEGEGAMDLAPNANIMAQIFQAYASYRPPFKRFLVRKFATSPHEESGDADVEPSAENPGLHMDIDQRSDGQNAIFYIPQSHAELLAEATNLFERIIFDSTSTPQSSSQSTSSPFDRVVLDTHLLNSYLAVHYAHASLETSRQMYDEVFSSQLGGLKIFRNSRTYLLTLQRCGESASITKGKDLSSQSLEFARMVWSQWSEHQNELKLAGRSESPRTTEKIWAAMLRVLAL
jgi:hypothetical protein